MRKAIMITIAVLLTGCDPQATRIPDLVRKACGHFEGLSKCIDAGGVSDPACVRAIREAAEKAGEAIR